MPAEQLPTGSSQQMQSGRGILVFDDGWHKLVDRAVAVRSDRARCAPGSVGPRSFPASRSTRPTTIVWEHENGIRGVWDITLAPDMYLRSDYYTNDERWEVTGHRGYARVNRCTGRGIQQPSLEVYVDGEMRGVPRARRRLGEQLPRFRPALAALAPHRRGPDALGCRRGRRRAAVRARRLREQRGGRRGNRSGVDSGERFLRLKKPPTPSPTRRLSEDSLASSARAGDRRLLGFHRRRSGTGEHRDRDAHPGEGKCAHHQPQRARG